MKAQRRSLYSQFVRAVSTSVRSLRVTLRESLDTTRRTLHDVETDAALCDDARMLRESIARASIVQRESQRVRDALNSD